MFKIIFVLFVFFMIYSDSAYYTRIPLHSKFNYKYRNQRVPNTTQVKFFNIFIQFQSSYYLTKMKDFTIKFTFYFSLMQFISFLLEFSENTKIIYTTTKRTNSFEFVKGNFFSMNFYNYCFVYIKWNWSMKFLQIFCSIVSTW